jgi:ParB-like chromosome segregation protein Spo0J
MGQIPKNFRQVYGATMVSDSFSVPIERVTVEEGFNVREDYGDIEGLAKDISKNGLLIPLLVKIDEDNRKVVLVDGHRRLQAIKFANEKRWFPGNTEDVRLLKEVRCIVEAEQSDPSSRLYAMFSTGTTSKPLTSEEQGKVFAILVRVNRLKPTAIAEQIGKTAAYVEDMLRLYRASNEIKSAVKENRISPTAAVKLTKAPKEKQVEVLTKHKDKKKITFQDVEKGTRGTTSLISARVVKNLIRKVDAVIEAKKSGGKDFKRYTAMKLAFEVVLGTKPFPKIED